MKFRTFCLLLVIILAVIGLIVPNSVRSALANNIWSTRMLQDFFSETGVDQTPDDPPPNHQHAPLFIARQALKLGETEKALSVTSAWAKQSDPVAMDFLAGLYYQHKDYAAAIEIWTELGDSLSLEGAVGELQSQGKTDLVILGFQSLYDVDPEKYSSGLALSLKSLGRNPEALALLESAVLAFPDSEYRGNWHRYMGDIFAQQQMYEEGEAAYQQALKIDPDNDRTWRNYSLLCKQYQQKHLDNETECYQRLLALGPSDPELYVAAGQVFEQAKLDQQALDAYLKALELDANQQSALEGQQRLSEIPLN